MNRKTRITILSFVLVMIFALPVTALANKRVFTADMRGEGDGTGSAILGVFPDGTGRFGITVRNLTGDPTAMHIHSAVDGSILLNLCSGGGCPANNSSFSGNITVGMLAPGVTAAQFVHLLETDQTYINVHTAANPGGEIWGTLFLH